MGAVYSGNFYTPIDVTMPKERILSILSTLKPGVMVIDEKSRKPATGLGYTGEIVVLEEILETEIDEADMDEVITVMDLLKLAEKYAKM